MITRKDLEYYNYDIAEYFEYIKESILNGQKQQAGKLFLKLSKQQRKDFLASLMEGTTTISGIELSTIRYCISLIY